MSFLHDYLDYATGNEAPELFHVWSGYVALSAAISRKVWLPFEDVAIFPNIYVMFVGGAGNGKSWAMQKVKRLLAELGDVPLSGSIETPQGLWRYMGGNPNTDPPIESPVRFITKWADGQLRECHPMTIIANEFVDFISLDDKGWINALNNIYDEDVYHYRTKNMGEDSLVGPYIVLLGALTTEVSSDLQKARIISTGLARRTIFQFGERKWHEPHPKPSFTDEQKAARARALAHLKVLRKVSGAFQWSPEVDEWWTAWYVPHLASVPKKAPQIQSWFASKSTQVLKVAMLTSLSERTDLVLTVPHFVTALAYLELLERDLYRIFGGVGRNELAMVATKIYEFISALTEPISKKQFFVKTFSLYSARDPRKEFDECLNHLKDDGKLVERLLTIGAGSSVVSDYIYATPEVMQAFEQAQAANSAPQHVATPPVSPPAVVPAARPSVVPDAEPPRPASTTPTVAASVPETGFVPPPTVGKRPHGML